MNRNSLKKAGSLFVMACCALFLALAGCGRQTTRLAVEGTVTFATAPVADGKISFLPLPGTSSPTAGATIHEGVFEIPAEKGLRPGQFRVEIRAVRETNKVIRDDLSGEVIPQKEAYIPKRYNDASELVVEIKPDTSNHLEFHLTK